MENHNNIPRNPSDEEIINIKRSTMIKNMRDCLEKLDLNGFQGVIAKFQGAFSGNIMDDSTVDMAEKVVIAEYIEKYKDDNDPERQRLINALKI